MILMANLESATAMSWDGETLEILFPPGRKFGVEKVQAREAELHFIAAGHYATETLGIRRVGEHLAKRFALRHVFLDVPNPV